jgi:EAL domain-containing protein (putative c-di-GMP-specific phosphodiesterase class I)
MDTQVKPEFLEFELTETVIVNNVEVITTIMEIRKLGVKFALDDFGTGNSSINYLKRLPLDKLKIDKSFIDDIASKGSDEIIIKAIIAMANSLNLDVLAEGVENQEQLNSLKNYHCDNIQGFLYSKALPPAELEEFFTQQSMAKIEPLKGKGQR